MCFSDPVDQRRRVTSLHGKRYLFLPVIRSYLERLPFLAMDRPYTFVFEFIHDVSHVLTKYRPEQFGLYLIGGRHLPTHRELSEVELDALADRLAVRRPRRFDSITDFATITDQFRLAAQTTPDFEGFIFRDRQTGARIKVKDPEYVRKHHLLADSSYKSLVCKALAGETEEIVAYFPHLAARLVEIQQAYAKYLDQAVQKIRTWQETGLTGRDLAVKLFGENPLSKWEQRQRRQRGEPPLQEVQPTEPDEFLRRLILKAISLPIDSVHHFVESQLRRLALGHNGQAGNPQRLLELLGYRGEASPAEAKASPQATEPEFTASDEL